jgi:hypothetical protein
MAEKMIGKTEILEIISEVVNAHGKGTIFTGKTCTDCCVTRGRRNCLVAKVMARLGVPDEVVQARPELCIDVFAERFSCANLTVNAAGILDRAHRAVCCYRNWGRALVEANYLAKVYDEE